MIAADSANEFLAKGTDQMEVQDRVRDMFISNRRQTSEQANAHLSRSSDQSIQSEMLDQGEVKEGACAHARPLRHDFRT